MQSIRRAAGLLLIKGDGSFLLQHRDNKPNIRFPGYWGFFGGGIGNDESPEAAMLRESKEELGIDVRDYQLALEQDFGDNHNPIGHKWIFMAPFEDQDPIELHEGQGMDWFRVEDLATLKIIEHDKIAIEKIINS